MIDLQSGRINLSDYIATLIGRLCKENVTDLVAILPHLDLAWFRETGDAIRVYRQRRSMPPEAHRSAGVCVAVDDLSTLALNSDGYGPHWFGFLVLEPLLTRLAPRPIVTIGPVLFEAGQGDTLARTAWLLARDLRERAGRDAAIDPDWVTLLALRALAIGELRSTTGRRRGRYDQSTDAGRADALACIDWQMEAATKAQGLKAAFADYWRGLHAWYSGTDPFAPTGPLAVMSGALRAYRDRAAPDDPRRHTAETLLAIGGLVWGGDAAPLDHLRPTGDRVMTLDAWLADVADESVPLAIPSPLLLAELEEIARWRWELEQRTKANEGRPDAFAIGRFIEWLETERAAVRLPIHELGLLRYLCENEEARQRGLRDALAFGVQIGFGVRNPYVEQGRESILEIEVRNQGATTAHDFEFDVTVQDGDLSSRHCGSRRLTAFAPGLLTPPITCRVQAQRPALWVRAAWRLRDDSGQYRQGDQSVTLEVRTPPQRPWTTIPQPYQAGVPVSGPGHFFGREAELMKVFGILSNPRVVQPLLLRGPRRMGKTSLLHQLQRLLLDPAELRGYPLAPGQIETIAQTCPVAFNLQELRQATGHAAYDGFFRTLLTRVRQALGDTAPSDPGEDYTDAVKAFRQALAGLLDRSGQRLLILLDEWDETARPDLSALSGNLRSLVQDERRVNWIISSTWIKRHEGRESGSPLHGVCDIREIAEFDWKTACQVLLEPADAQGFYWHGDAVVAAVEQTGQWPFLLQMLGAGVVNDLNARLSPPVVTSDSVAAVIGRMVRSEFPSATSWFESIFKQKAPDGTDGDAVRAVGKLILWALNEPQQSAGAGLLSFDDLKAAVQRHAPDRLRSRREWPAWFYAEFVDQVQLLEEIQYAIGRDAGQRYRIRVPIFGAWFRHWAKGSYQQTLDGLEFDLERDVVRRHWRQP